MGVIGQATNDSVISSSMFVVSILVGALCATGGALIAKSNDASPVLGALFGLMCGLLGLYLASRLQPRVRGSRRRQVRPSMLEHSELNQPRVIDPEVARKLGLPPQRGTFPGSTTGGGLPPLD